MLLLDWMEVSFSFFFQTVIDRIFLHNLVAVTNSRMLICSFQLICRGLRDFVLNKSNSPKADPRFFRAAAYGTDAPDELRKLVDQVAINIHGLYVLKSSSEHSQYDPFRLSQFVSLIKLSKWLLRIR